MAEAAHVRLVRERENLIRQGRSRTEVLTARLWRQVLVAFRRQLCRVQVAAGLPGYVTASDARRYGRIRSKLQSCGWSDAAINEHICNWILGARPPAVRYVKRVNPVTGDVVYLKKPGVNPRKFIPKEIYDDIAELAVIHCHGRVDPETSLQYAVGPRLIDTLKDKGRSESQIAAARKPRKDKFARLMETAVTSLANGGARKPDIHQVLSKMEELDPKRYTLLDRNREPLSWRSASGAEKKMPLQAAEKRLKRLLEKQNATK